MKIGTYELLEVIGRGGMGTVYRAFHQDTGLIVAIKTFTTSLPSTSVLIKRFEQECAVCLRLQHPNIVRGLDFGVENDQRFLVMEFVEGKSLAKHVMENGPLSPEDAVRVIKESADAIQLAHENKLIHRDIKPENILLTTTLQAKVTDLGLVKDLDASDELTQTGTWLGTIDYMAPEQFGDARHVDPRTDVYGLAATFYFALTGAVPFPGKGNLSVLAKKLQNDFIPLQQRIANLDPIIAEVIAQSLNAEPSNRPNSCKDFINRLEKKTPLIDSSGSSTLPHMKGVVEVVEEDSNWDEKRNSFRFPSILEGVCQPMIGSKERWPAEVLDISLTGARLKLPRRFEPGATLRFELTLPNTGDTVLYGRVQWVRSNGSEVWMMGCKFSSPLSQDDLNQLLGNHASTIIIHPPRQK